MQAGMWGWQHIMLEVAEGRAELTFDCAHGTIDQPLDFDAAGRFDLRGTFVREHGGPVRSDETPPKLQARYAGRVEGKSMTLTVTLPDTKETVGTFSLTHGEQPDLTKCL